VSAEPIFECFNVLVQNKLYNIALNLGGHILRTLDKFISDIPQQKRFLLKFMFVFDKIASD